MLNLGNLLILFTALFTATAMAAYLPGVRAGRGRPHFRVARAGVYLAGLGLVLASAHLWQLILTHQFQVDYVYRYSSRDLPLRYLISAFWGGQEGTFLLWALFGGMLAIFLRWKARHYEAPVQFFYLGINLFLLLILLKRSPFATLSMVPPDGAGLNPLLQDPWMVIHPPVVFFGFAALGIPAAYAMAAMVKEDWDSWVRDSLPWTSFGVLALGLGLVLGGYWAYSILGWGGFWGWDPVENSSLVPWLMASVLLHNQLIQLKKGLYRRANLLLALVPFLLLTYSTFLTRSGILADFSVHSFTDLGINQLLVLFMAAFGGGGIALWVWKQGKVPLVKDSNRFWSREVITFLGAMSLALFGVTVLLGTSAPLITRLTGAPSSVQPEFYNSVALPYAILLALLVAIAPHFVWKHTEGAVLLHRLRWPLAGAAVSAPLLFLAGIKSPAHLLLSVLSMFALLSNLRAFWAIIRINPRAMGGTVAHAGLALCILGILVSTAYTRSRVLTLPQGQEVNALGYDLIYMGHRSVENGKKTAYEVGVRTENAAYLLSPTMFYSEMNQGMMKKPAIRSFFTHDVYVSPIRTTTESLEERLRSTIEVERGVPLETHNMVLLLRDLERTGSPAGSHGHGVEDVTGTVDITIAGETHTLHPVLRVHPRGATETLHVEIPGSGHSVTLVQADPATGEAVLGVQPMPMAIAKGETATVFGYRIQHNGFRVEMSPDPGVQGVVVANAVVEAGNQQIPVNPGIRILNDGRTFQEAPIGETGMNLVLTAFDSNTGEGLYQVTRPPREFLQIEASIKPFILLLWIGSLIMSFGLVISTFYRARLAVRKVTGGKHGGEAGAVQMTPANAAHAGSKKKRKTA